MHLPLLQHKDANEMMVEMFSTIDLQKKPNVCMFNMVFNFVAIYVYGWLISGVIH